MICKIITFAFYFMSHTVNNGKIKHKIFFSRYYINLFCSIGICFYPEFQKFLWEL